MAVAPAESRASLSSRRSARVLPDGVERQVGCADVVEHDLVIGPHLSDKQERDGIGEIGRPERDEVMQQVAVVSRRPDFQDEQRDRDGEDGIAERHQPPGVTVDGGCVGPRRTNYSARGWTVNPSCPSTLTEPAFPPSKSPEARRSPVANS
jgi:hypothetical protein